MNGMGYCNEELAQHLVQRLIIENSRMLVLRCLYTRMECLVVLEINLTVVHMKYRHFRYKSSPQTPPNFCSISDLSNI